MFCNQCEQTNQKNGCTTIGVCGKTDETATLQDLLTFAVQGFCKVAVAGRKKGVKDPDANRFMLKALFSTLTNVNFDLDRLQDYIHETVERREDLRCRIVGAGGSDQFDDPAVKFYPEKDMAALLEQGQMVGLPIDRDRNNDVASLQETVLYGIRGVAAYADHAAILGCEDETIYESLQEKIAVFTDKTLGLEDWIGLAMDVGKTNLKAMELLDKGNTSHFGHPEPTQVSIGGKPGKAILVSGHDLKDLETLLKQTENKGINVYTHGEMLPGHAYPELKKYKHLTGHFGTAWQNQSKELSDFPGPVLFTTNCIQKPEDNYKDNIFTTGVTGWHGTCHVGNNDFTQVIEKAMATPGFKAEKKAGTTWVGYGRNTILKKHPMGSVIDTLVDYTKAGTIRHFFLVGGCDGAKSGRNYYSDFVDQAPKDTVILTLACGKFRFFDRDLGAIDGVPRLVDVGQCNDAYSAIVIAQALSEALGKEISDLPLSLILSWYEQKAVSILLTLFYLGFKGIRLGPSMPAFLTPNVVKMLSDTFNIQPIRTPEKDIADCLGK